MSTEEDEIVRSKRAVARANRISAVLIVLVVAMVLSFIVFAAVMIHSDLEVLAKPGPSGQPRAASSSPASTLDAGP